MVVLKNIYETPLSSLLQMKVNEINNQTIRRKLGKHRNQMEVLVVLKTLHKTRIKKLQKLNAYVKQNYLQN